MGNRQGKGKENQDERQTDSKVEPEEPVAQQPRSEPVDCVIIGAPQDDAICTILEGKFNEASISCYSNLAESNDASKLVGKAIVDAKIIVYIVSETSGKSENCAKLLSQSSCYLHDKVIMLVSRDEKETLFASMEGKLKAALLKCSWTVFSDNPADSCWNSFMEQVYKHLAQPVQEDNRPPQRSSRFNTKSLCTTTENGTKSTEEVVDSFCNQNFHDEVEVQSTTAVENVAAIKQLPSDADLPLSSVTASPSILATDGSAASPSDSLRANTIVLKKLQELNTSFADLTSNANKLLIGHDFSDVLLNLSSYFGTEEFTSCHNIHELLVLLQKRTSVFNVYAFQSLAKHFKIDELAECIKKYDDDMAAFLEDTKVKEFQEAVADKADSSSRTMKELTIKVTHRFATCRTMEAIVILAELALEDCSKYLLCLHAKIGSVIISWLFPESLSDKIEELVGENEAVFQDATGVLEVTVAGKVVYSANTLEEVPLDGDSTTSTSTRGGADFELLCAGAVKYYSFNLANLASKKTAPDIGQELVKQLDSTVKELEFQSDQKVAQIYIGITYILHWRKQEFDPLNHNTWKKESISVRWSYLKNQGYGRDGMVVLCAITEDTVPLKEKHQEHFTIEMKQYLLHHYRDDPRLANCRTYSRLRRNCDAYAIYMAFRYADDTTARKQEKTTTASVV